MMRMPGGSVRFGPPVGEGWRSETRWWRTFECACGYMGREYWNEDRESTLVCTKCGNGRPVTHPQERE